MQAIFFAAAVLSVVISVAIVLSLAGRRDRLPVARSISARCGRGGWFPRRNLFDVKHDLRRDADGVA